MTTQAQFNLENYLTKNKLDKCKTNKKDYLEPIINFFNLQKPNLMNEVFVSFHQGLSHIHELHHGCQALNMNIIWLIRVDVYKHVKILNAQPKPFEVCANICNVENFFCLNLKTNNPQYLLGYRPNVRELYFMHYPPC